jgi:hypothetical protein
MWRSFYGNFGKSMRDAPLKTKLRVLDRNVLPIASCRMSRWPYQVNAANRINRTQNKLISMLLGLRFRPGEDFAAFALRRNREASRVAATCDRWSEVWRKRVINWNSHLGRDRNGRSWAVKTLHYHGKTWLQHQRFLHSVGQWCSLFPGRTGTRAMPGIVHKRRHDGVDTAMNM